MLPPADPSPQGGPKVDFIADVVTFSRADIVNGTSWPAGQHFATQEDLTRTCMEAVKRGIAIGRQEKAQPPASPEGPTPPDYLGDILWAAYKFDDKPHHLFSAIARAAREAEWMQKGDRAEACRLMEIMYTKGRECFALLKATPDGTAPSEPDEELRWQMMTGRTGKLPPAPSEPGTVSEAALITYREGFLSARTKLGFEVNDSVRAGLAAAFPVMLADVLGRKSCRDFGSLIARLFDAHDADIIGSEAACRALLRAFLSPHHQEAPK